jgi:hypothetical protein
VIASHYAVPTERRLAKATELRCAPSAEAAVICTLEEGAAVAVLDDTLGWAWGYAGDGRRVGYLLSTALAA